MTNENIPINLTLNATKKENVTLAAQCGLIGVTFGGFLFTLVKSVTKNTLTDVNKMLADYDLVPKNPEV